MYTLYSFFFSSNPPNKITSTKAVKSPRGHPTAAPAPLPAATHRSSGLSGLGAAHVGFSDLGVFIIPTCRNSDIQKLYMII